jgi:hypothetical protein
MKIKFTLTLSDETVAAFNVIGVTNGEAIKDNMVGALRAFIEQVKKDADEEDPDDDEDDDDDDEEELDEAPPVKKKPAPKKANNTRKKK